MDPIEDYPQGHWTVGDQKFINKYQALLHGQLTNQQINFVYFDEVWRSFDRGLLGKFSLQELYKQRAQQLRDKYDYLILYFSGGADSWNVLRSFVDNGIHLDEVCVKWCKDTIKSTIYTPNEKETSAINYLSEWDYAINPALEWLKQNHPTVNIEIVDWFADKKLNRLEDTFQLVNHWHDVEVHSLAVWSPSENKMIDKGKTVGSIYGIDKPITYFDDGNAYMAFTDGGTGMGTPNPINIYGTEYFYWSPAFPILSFEMAYQTILAFQADKQFAKSAFIKDNRFNTEFMVSAWQIQQKKLRHILYDNWTDRFQAFKPMTPDRSDKHWWIFKHPELVRYREVFTDMFSMHRDKLILSGVVNDELLTPYKSIPTKRIFVCPSTISTVV
jgi:hypothetical protein